MPIYEYKCEACEHELEALQKMSDDPLKQCPACGEASLIKKISAAAFRLKGGGWYETDFKSGKQKNIAKSDSDSKSKTSQGGDKPASSNKSDASSGSKKTES
ncbi:hypothetical protein TDB9533_01400 [Thalassocella blandensis]|nr:hypothetical protein TDB9533_01400 [Thalassocella blandensis]